MKTSRPTERGFTLIELVMTSSIVAIVTLMGISEFHNITSRGSTDGMALQVAEDLRQAAQKAVATGSQVAVVFPTNGGTQPVTSGYYVLEGATNPQITRTQELSKAYPGTALFLGSWPTSGGASFNPAPALPGNLWSNFNIANWVAPPALPAANGQDNFFVFQPDGTVVSNGQNLLSSDGCYHVVVTSGAHYAGASPNFQLTQAGQCWTVSISPLGAVTSTGGLLAAAPGVAGAGQASNQADPAAAKPLATAPSVISTPTAVAGSPGTQPEPNPLSTPVQNGEMYVGQIATLFMGATSNSNQPLFVKWIQQAVVDKMGLPATRGAGSFSYPPDGGRMMFDAGRQAYTSYWQWTPPAGPSGAQPGDVFSLQCAVSNDPTGSVALTIVSNVTIIPPGHVLYETNRTDGKSLGPTGVAIFSMNVNGSPKVPRLFQRGYIQPSATPDEARIVFVSATDGNIYMCTPYSPPVQMTTGGGPYTIPAISSNGNQIAFMNSAQTQLYVMKAFKGASPEAGFPVSVTPDANLMSPAPNRNKLSWDSTGNKLFFASSGNLMEMDYSPTANSWSSPATVINGNGVDLLGSPSAGFGPSGSNLYFETDNSDGLGGKWDPYLCFTPFAPTGGGWSTAGLPAGMPAGSWYHWSDYADEALPERDPAGTTQVMENYAWNASAPPVFSSVMQIVVVNATAANLAGPLGKPTSGSFPPNSPVIGLPTGTKVLTNSPQPSYCMRPVWTK